MGQIEELKVFVSERLHAVASEILGAIEKATTDYEQQTSRLKEENDRNRSLLDIILKAKLPQTEAGHAIKSAPAATSPRASDSSPTPEARETPCHSSELERVFTSRSDFLKFATKAANGNCPYCLKSTQATETHLMRRHYLLAVHYTEDGTDKFVVPCLCKDRIQVNGRSHWHCPYCRKIIFRRCNFEQHISKQHTIPIQQECQGVETDQPPVSAFEEEAPISSETWCQQEPGSLGREDQQTSLLLQMKGEEKQKMCERVSHPDLHNSKQLQLKGDQIQKGNSRMEEQSLAVNHAQYSTSSIVCLGGYIQDPSQINSVESFSSSSTQPRDTQPKSGIVGKSQHTTEDKIEELRKNDTPSSLKALNSKRTKLVKISLTALSLNMKKSTQLSVSQNPTGPYCCKACGKTFHHMHTLRTHAHVHKVDKIHICGICGKNVESTESLAQHLQNHRKSKECGTCGKQFSYNSRLKRHMKCHRPKGLNVTSSV